MGLKVPIGANYGLLKEYSTVSAEVPRCSILGPILWNVVFGDVRALELPIGTLIMDFAADN